MKNAWKLMIAALVFAAPVGAGGEIEEVWDVDLDCLLRVENVAGKIEVDGWDREQIQVKVSFNDDVEHVALERSRNAPSVRIIIPKRRVRKADADVKIRVPFGASVDLSAVSADIDVAGIEGDVKAHGVSGNVSIKASGSRVDAETVSGDVEVEGMLESVEIGTSSGKATFDGDAPFVKMESISGDVRATGTVGEGHADTTSGQVTFKGMVHALRAQCISGDIDVDTLGRRGELETVSGNVEVEASGVERLEVKSISGDVDVRAELSEHAEVDMSTRSGKVDLALPKGTSARYVLETFSGNLKSELGPAQSRSLGPRASVTFTVGGGDADVELGSMSGDIQLKAR